MAGKKISQLTKLTELTGTEIIPVAKDGQNYGVETLALLGISVYDIPEPLDDNYIYTPEQLAEIKKSIFFDLIRMELFKGRRKQVQDIITKCFFK